MSVRYLRFGSVDAAVSSTSVTTASNLCKIATPTPVNSLLSRCLDQPQPTNKPTSTPLNELHDYMLLNVQIDEQDDVLLFWKKNEKSFPLLSSIIRDLLLYLLRIQLLRDSFQHRKIL